jgi:hypothetical protein
MDRKSAEKIVALFDKASALCDDSLKVIKRNENLGHVQVFGKLAGQFLGHSYTNILAPIWKAFPDLEPAEMKEPYIEPQLILTPESQAALSAFVVAAREAIESTKNLTTPSESENMFSFGGLPEVDHAVTEIDGFLKYPRFRDEPPGQ